MVDTPAVKRASSGLVSARPDAEIWTSTSSRWSPRASGGGLSQAASRAAYAAAYRAARARAESYAEAAALRIDRVLAIRDVHGDDGPIVMDEMAMNADARQQAVAAPPVMAGRNSSEVRIRVDFALAPQ